LTGAVLVGVNHINKETLEEAMHRYKTVLTGVIFALIVGLAQAANVVYVTSFDNDSVLKFDADTGAFLGVFVPAGSGGLNGPTGLTFGAGWSSLCVQLCLQQQRA
jgi:hypothetical protein